MRDCIVIPEITAGLAFSLVVDLGSRGINADTHTVTLYLRGPKAVDVAATGSGSVFTFEAETADWGPGTYWWTMRADDGAGGIKEVARGEVQVIPDLVAAGDGYDGRSQWAIGLEAIDAVIAKRATLDQERYRINNRELYRTPIADLLKLRAYYAAKVKQENRKGAGGFGRAVLVKFCS